MAISMESPDQAVEQLSAAVHTMVPAFLSAIGVVELRAARPGWPGSLFALAVRREGRLKGPFLLEKQQQSNWCWASAAAAVHRYIKNAPLSQCVIVQRTRDPVGIDCCIHPAHSNCNVTEKISTVLDKLGVKRVNTLPLPPLPFKRIGEEIARDRPIICGMAGGDTAHFVVMIGWAEIDNVPHVIVDDPAVGGRKERSLERFKTDFDGRRWAQTTLLV